MANTKVTTGVIKDDAVGADQLASNSVVTASIVDNAITTAKINDDAILTAKISNSAITNAKMSANSVDSDQYVDGSIDTAHIGDGQITSAKLDTNIAVAGTLTLGSHLIMGDNDRIKIGSGTDLEIYHDGSDTFIDDSTGTGNLYVLSNQFLVNNANGTQNMGRFADGGAVTLYYAGAAKLATTSSGIDVTGTAVTDGLTATGVIVTEGDAAVNDAQIGRLNFTNTNSNASSNPIRASILAGRQNSAWGGYLSLYTSTGTDAASEKVRITETGNVLVGTTTFNNLSTESGVLASNNVVMARGGLNDHQDACGVLQYSSDATWLRAYGDTAGSGYLIFRTGGGAGSSDTERMRITAAGATRIVAGNSLELQNAAGNNEAIIRCDGAGTNTDLRFDTGGQERVRIDNSGSVQIGTSNPSGNKGITIQAGTNSSASLRLKNDAHDWDVNCQTNDKFAIYSHTAGTERLVIDTSGNVGIGRTNPLNTLHIYGAGQNTANITDSGNQGGMLRISDSQTTAGSGGGIIFANSQGDNVGKAGFAAIKGLLNNGTGNTQGSLAFSTRNSINGSALTERMRIKYNGNIGIGSTDPLQKLTVSGSVWASGYYITALQGNSQLTNASTSSGSNPSYIGQGLITVTISDAKAKENFGSVETNECLNKIVSLSEHVKKFDWIDEDWKKEKGRTVGMVAQEIYEDHSEFVHKPENYDDDGWAIRYQEIVPTLVKAIQEQQTQIETLKAEIQELKG